MPPETHEAAALEFRPLTPELAGALGRLLHDLRDAGDEPRFHPHPLDGAAAERIARDAGEDLYYVVTGAGDAVLAYGMLRGWAHHDVPSLGIAVHPAHRGKGIGALLMRFLHDAARKRGAPAVRLRVDPDNVAARRLYERLGYEFAGEERGQLVGRLEL